MTVYNCIGINCFITAITHVTISPSCIINSTCIQTPSPIVSSDTFTSGGPWAAGGVLVGVVSGIFVMVMIWVIVTVFRKKKTGTKSNENR